MDHYFNELEEQIMNKEKWDRKRFRVFNHEAGSGKSQNTFRILGGMFQRKTCKLLAETSNHYRVLYVQQFVKDDQLVITAETINTFAGKKVAMAFDRDDNKSKKRKKLAEESPILCISHNMYLQICYDNNGYLFEDRDILIIDEYPNLLKKVSVKYNDICNLWMESYKYKSDTIEELASKFRKWFNNRFYQPDQLKTNQMQFIDFTDKEYEIVKNELKQLIPSTNNKKDKELFIKFQQTLENGCFFYEDGFHTFDNRLKFKLLENNIILDANAGFDHRYNLSKLFHVRKQPLYFDYSHSTLHHFKINTGKNALSKLIDFPEKVYEQLTPEQKENLLLITDLDNKSKFEEDLKDRFLTLGVDNDKIQELVDKKVKIDYFGNIIGVNTYRDFSAIAVVKTPNYDYLTYALTYFYYSFIENRKVGNIEVFKHDEIEKLRVSAVAGEIYQAIKRINRDNSQSSQIYVFTDYQEALDIVLQQLPNVNYKTNEFKVHKSKKSSDNQEKRETLFERKVKDTKNFLLDLREKGEKSVQKKVLREKVKEADKSNFSKILRAMAPFLEENNFLNEGQKIHLYK